MPWLKKPRPYKHPQINLRIPEDLTIKIQELADNNGWSMSSEIIDRPKKSIDKSNEIRKMDPDYFYDEIEKILDKYCKRKFLIKKK